MIWAALIGTAVALYVILDGFDLGTGILFPYAANERERDQMMNSVAPFWDGNETWLVLGGGGLLVAFPRAYAVVMPALYIPVIVMLLALVFRGVAFEFRWIAVDQQEVLEFCLRRRLDLGGVLPGDHPRRPAAGHQGGERRFRRRTRSTGRRRSRSSAVSAWSPAMRCSARPGW